MRARSLLSRISATTATPNAMCRESGWLSIRVRQRCMGAVRQQPRGRATGDYSGELSCTLPGPAATVCAFLRNPARRIWTCRGTTREVRAAAHRELRGGCRARRQNAPDVRARYDDARDPGSRTVATESLALGDRRLSAPPASGPSRGPAPLHRRSLPLCSRLRHPQRGPCLPLRDG